MNENIPAELPVKDSFPTWRIVVWAFGAAGSTIIGSLLLPSLLLLGRSTENPSGVRWVAILSAICVEAAFVMLYFLYDERMILSSLKTYGYE